MANPFKRKKRTAVMTTVVRVMEEDQLPDATKSALIQAILGNESIADTLLDAQLNSPGLLVDRMYQYGKTEYSYGLPVNRTFSSTDGEAVGKSVIEMEVGQPVTLDYFHFGPPSNVHLGWKILTESYGYNPLTNEIESLSAQLGHTVYLYNLIPVHSPEVVAESEPGTLVTWGIPAKAGFTPSRPAMTNPTLQMTLAYAQGITGSAPYEQVLVEYEYRDSAGVIQGGEQLLNLSAYDLDDDYYQARYHYTDGDTQVVGYWLYTSGTGTYPLLDNLYEPGVNTGGTYFPFTYFRRYGENRTASALHDTQAYLTSVKLLDRMGMDYQSMSDSVHDNPDIGDVQQAVMMFAVPLISTVPVEMRYLHSYFRRLHFAQTPVSSTIDWRADELPLSALVIEDGDFRMNIGYRNVYRRLRAGSIGPINTYSNTGGEYSYTIWVEEGGRDDSTELVQETITVPKRTFCRQLSATFYEEIAVINPTVRYNIYRGRIHSADADDDEALIPLDMALLDYYNIPEKEDLYFRSLQFVFNSQKTTKERWYETSFFRGVLIIGAIALTAFSLGKTYGVLIAAWGIGISMFALTVAIIIIGQMVLTYAYEKTVKELGLENSFLLAVIGAIAAFYIGYQAGGLEGAPWAQALLEISHGLLAGMETESNRLISGLSGEMDSFNLMGQEEMAELKEIQDALDVTHMIDPFAFIGRSPRFVPGETADNFYTRSIHSGNIGTLGFAAIEQYAEIALTLPTFNDTIEDFSNESV